MTRCSGLIERPNKKKNILCSFENCKVIWVFFRVVSENLTQNMYHTINDPIRHQRPGIGVRGDRPRGGGALVFGT